MSPNLPYDAERDWPLRGPDSGGVAGWALWRGRIYWYEHEGHTGHVSEGVEVAAWLERHRDDPTVAAIVDELEER